LILQRGSISLYTDAPVETRDIIEAVTIIKKSFPSLPVGFYDILDDRLRANWFTAQRLKDAVEFVVDNCIYPTPTIANFISFDRTVKFKTHDQMCKEELWDTYVPVKFPDMPKVIWIFANDVEKYKLQKYLVK